MDNLAFEFDAIMIKIINEAFAEGWDLDVNVDAGLYHPLPLFSNRCLKLLSLMWEKCDCWGYTMYGPNEPISTRKGVIFVDAHSPRSCYLTGKALEFVVENFIYFMRCRLHMFSMDTMRSNDDISEFLLRRRKVHIPDFVNYQQTDIGKIHVNFLLYMLSLDEKEWSKDSSGVSAPIAQIENDHAQTADLRSISADPNVVERCCVCGINGVVG